LFLGKKDRKTRASELKIAESKQTQAERQAYVTLRDAEAHVSDEFSQAACVQSENPGALHLLGMKMLYKAICEKGVIVIFPSPAVETMGLGGTLAKQHST
jgi:hypothetical protein